MPEADELILPPVLRERLTQGQCVAYIGAGFTMACGMPGWEQLFRALLDEVRRGGKTLDDVRVEACAPAIESGRFDEAGSMLKALLMPADFDAVIQQQFGTGRLAEAFGQGRQEQLDRLRYLTGGPWAGIVTTNYDTLIETALAERVVGHRDHDRTQHPRAEFGDREVVIVQGDDARIGTILARPPAGGFFVKIHGSISGPNVVLSTEDYDRTYLATPRMTSFLSSLMLRYHVVFLGCSLEDELVRLRRKLALEFNGLIPVAYALMPAGREIRQRTGWLRDRAAIECITYQPDDLHTAVGVFLKEAAGCADWARRRDAAPAITGNLRDRAISDRLAAIGETNVRLLRLIARQEDRSVDHAELVELDRLTPETADASLYRLSAEERVYRVLFLVSIGLVDEKVDTAGVLQYRVNDDVVDTLG